MQIVIDIDDDIYCRIVTQKDYAYDVMRTIKAVERGKVLPEGHGRLIDAEDVDNHIIGHVDLRCCPTIIEADKEGANE